MNLIFGSYLLLCLYTKLVRFIWNQHFFLRKRLCLDMKLGLFENLLQKMVYRSHL